MKFLLVFLSFFFCTSSFAQPLDFGEVKGEEGAGYCPPYWEELACHSDWPLRIDLVWNGYFPGEYKHFLLAFDGSKWIAIKYKGMQMRPPLDSVNLEPATSFEDLFVQLKQNGVFTLPDQGTLPVNGTVDDGDDYVLSFRAGTKFRRYEIHNPELYLEDNKDIKELACYAKIIDLFYNGLMGRHP